MPFYTVSFIGQQPVASGIVRIEAADKNDACRALGKIIPVVKIRDVFRSSEQGHPGALPKVTVKPACADIRIRQEVLPV